VTGLDGGGTGAGTGAGALIGSGCETTAAVADDTDDGCVATFGTSGGCAVAIFFSGGALAGSGPEPITSASDCDTALVLLETLLELSKTHTKTR